ncbi:MAG: pyruvate synthase subunit beta [Candidatus Hydrogenedentota bacterium]|nr:MAG: pyruvate synthase subunit beta [Candidatus Hydrogenedentota bacterium]
MNHEKIHEEELVCSGHYACQGCGGVVALRHALRSLGPRTVVVIPACCWSVIAGPFPYSALRVPVFHAAFETAGSTASGIRAALDIQGKGDISVLAWAGDGGTFDIGLQSLSGAVERNENIIYACYDNEAYMNTGIQRSSATPLSAWTTTTPELFPKETPKKDIVQILAGHKIPYVATASIGFPDDLNAKFRKAKEIMGTKFLHVLAPCPPGWKYSSELTITLARLATHCKAFPIYEVFDGEDYVINIEPAGKPVAEYLAMQGRFSHLTERQIKEIQARVDYHWEHLLHRAMLEKFQFEEA